ncbi:hypothetical protein EV121DRAFT_294247 [Schizophyllum commune]
MSQELGTDGNPSVLGKRAADGTQGGRKTTLANLHFKKLSQQPPARDGTPSDQMDELEDGAGGSEKGDTRPEDEGAGATTKEEYAILPSRREFTPRPRTGNPEIVGHTVESVLMGMGLQHRADIKACPDPHKFFVYTCVPICDRRPTMVEKIEKVVNDMAPVEGVTLEVAPPVLAKGTEMEDYDDSLTPKMYLVTGATRGQRDAILSRQIWSCDELTLIAIPVEPPIDEFLFTLSGYTLKDTVAAKEIVRARVYDIIFANTEAARFLLDCFANQFDRDPENYKEDLDDATDWAIGILHTIHVRSEVVEAGETTQVNWRVYCTPPTQNVAEHKAWIDIVTKLDYPIPLRGRPMVFRFDSPNMRCGTCLSVDHRTGRCRLPDIQGWKGPAKKARYVEPAKEAEVQIKVDKDDFRVVKRGKTKDERRDDERGGDKRKGREGRNKREEGSRKGKGKAR